MIAPYRPFTLQATVGKSLIHYAPPWLQHCRSLLRRRERAVNFSALRSMHKCRIDRSLNSTMKVAPFTGKSFLSCTAAGHEHVGNWRRVRKRERSCFMHLIEGLSDKLHADRMPAVIGRLP